MTNTHIHVYIYVHIYIYIYIYIMTMHNSNNNVQSNTTSNDNDYSDPPLRDMSRIYWLCRICGAVFQLATPRLCLMRLFTLPVSCVTFQTSVNKSTPNFCAPSRDKILLTLSPMKLPCWRSCYHWHYCRYRPSFLLLLLIKLMVNKQISASID